MALDVRDVVVCCLGNELGIHIGIAGDERHVHDGAVFLAGSALEQLGLVEEVVQQRGLLVVALADALEATLLLEPLEDEAADVNRVASRRVVQAAGISHGLPTQQRRGEGQHVFADEILTGDDDGQTSRADVLLNTTVDDAVLRNVNRLGEEARRHVCDQGYVARLGQLVVDGAVNRLVLADVEVVGVLGNLDGVDVGHVAERLVLAGRQAVRGAVHLRFLEGLLRPGTGNDVVGHAAFDLHEVHRNGGELRGGATLEEQHLVVLGDAHEVAQVGLSGVDDVLERLRAMAHLHDGHACALVVEHFGCSLLQNRFRQDGGTCRKVVNPGHRYLLAEKYVVTL